jgi:hypothetical protein
MLQNRMLGNVDHLIAKDKKEDRPSDAAKSRTLERLKMI